MPDEPVDAGCLFSWSTNALAASNASGLIVLDAKASTASDFMCGNVDYPHRTGLVWGLLEGVVGCVEFRFVGHLRGRR